jgi:hypothetical protein
VKKRYMAICPSETLEMAKEWTDSLLGDSKKRAHISGKEGIENGMGKIYRLVEITYKVLPDIYKGSQPVKDDK